MLVSRATGRTEQVLWLRHMPREGASPTQHPVLAHHVRAGVPGADGWISVLRIQPYRVDWRDPSGRWVNGAPLPVPEIPFDNAEREAYIQRTGRREAYTQWPQSVPPFTAGFQPSLSRDGKVLVRRVPSSRAPGIRYDVVNHRGEARATDRVRGRAVLCPRIGGAIGLYRQPGQRRCADRDQAPLAIAVIPSEARDDRVVSRFTVARPLPPPRPLAGSARCADRPDHRARVRAHARPGNPTGDRLRIRA